MAAPLRSRIDRFALGAAVVFAVVAVASTAVVRASGRQMIDVNVYRAYGDEMKRGLVPYRDFDFEYPPGALAVFVLPSLVTSAPTRYYRAFSALMAIVGGIAVILTAASLACLGRSRRTVRRVLALVAFSPVLFGGVLLTRFDLVPAALVAGVTVLLLAGRARGAALTLGCAVAVKLYPLALLPLLAAWAWRRHGRREAVVATGLTLGVSIAAYLPFAVLAPGGVASSLWRQLGRPLQIESLGAGVLLVLHSAFGLPIELDKSHGSDNLVGVSGATVALTLSVVQLIVLMWLWARFARGEPGDERLVRYAAAALLAFVALGKVLSPQFLLWLLFAVPLVGGRRGAVSGALYGAAALATAVWFPFLYDDLVWNHDAGESSLVLLRGAALVGALVVLAWPAGEIRARGSARPRSRSPARSPGRT